jgi:acyl carrier protein
MTAEITVPPSVVDVRSVLAATLGIDAQRAATIDAGTELLGTVPELDSMAVVELVYALEERFAIAIDGDEITADVFETLGSLTEFVGTKFRA